MTLAALWWHRLVETSTEPTREGSRDPRKSPASNLNCSKQWIAYGISRSLHAALSWSKMPHRYANPVSQRTGRRRCYADTPDWCLDAHMAASNPTNSADHGSALPYDSHDTSPTISNEEPPMQGSPCADTHAPLNGNEG